MESVVTSLLMPKETLGQLREIARDDRRSVAFVIREGIALLLEQYRQQGVNKTWKGYGKGNKE